MGEADRVCSGSPFDVAEVCFGNMPEPRAARYAAPLLGYVAKEWPTKLHGPGAVPAQPTQIGDGNTDTPQRLVIVGGI